MGREERVDLSLVLGELFAQAGRRRFDLIQLVFGRPNGRLIARDRVHQLRDAGVEARLLIEVCIQLRIQRAPCLGQPDGLTLRSGCGILNTKRRTSRCGKS